MSVENLVSDKCKSIIDKHGYELVKVEYKEEFGAWELCLFVKSKTGEAITHKDCNIVTKAINGTLEKLDPTKGQPYNLSVSSVGIEI